MKFKIALFALLLAFLPLSAFAYTVQTTTATANISGSWGFDNGGGTTVLFVSQSFKTIGAGTLTNVLINASQVGSPVDHVFYEIRTDTTSGCGTVAGGHCPSSTVVGTSNNADVTTADPTNQAVNVSASISLNAATTYWVLMKRTGSNSGTQYYHANFGSATSACTDTSLYQIRQVNGTWSDGGSGGGQSCWNITATITTAASSYNDFSGWWNILY